SHRVVDTLGDLEELLPAGRLGHRLRHSPEHARPRVVDPVNAVAEPGHAYLRIAALLLGEPRARAHARLDVALGARGLTDLEQHRQHVLVGATVTRPLQGRD